MLICHLFSRRLQAALLLLGVKAGTVSYGELWPGQRVQIPASHMDSPMFPGVTGPDPSPKTFPKGRGEGTTRRWCGSLLPQPEAAWVTVGWEGLCQPSPMVHNSSLSEWTCISCFSQPGHICEAVLTTSNLQTRPLSLKEICTEKI